MNEINNFIIKHRQIINDVITNIKKNFKISKNIFPKNNNLRLIFNSKKIIIQFYHNSIWKKINNDLYNILDEEQKNIYDFYYKLKKNGLYSSIIKSNNEYIEIYNGKIINSKNKSENYIINNMISFSRETKIKELLNNNNIYDIIYNNNILKSYCGLLKPYLIFEKNIEQKNSDFNNKLNMFQQQLTNLQNLYNINIYCGPPGTGKSFTIVSFINEIIMNTNFNIILLSEKNCSITSVIEYLYKLIYNDTSFNEQLWKKTFTFGSYNASPKVKNFFVKNKLNNHPNIIKLNKKYNDFYNLIDLDEKIKKYILDKCEEKKLLLYDFIENKKKIYELKNSNSIEYKNEAKQFMKKILEYLVNINISNFLYSTFYVGKIDFETFISSIFKDELLLIGKKFINSLEYINEILFINIEKNKILDSCKNQNGKIFLSTIGSLNSMINFFEQNNIKNKDTIIIFDESSTIPSYEIFNLCLINQNIKSLIIVGDPKQLSPFHMTIETIDLDNLFDISNNVSHNYFELQYRIPYDIANILNKYIYDGKYKSFYKNKNGIDFYDIKNNNYDLDYNYDEINKIIDIYNKYKKKYKIFILSPYKEQINIIKKV